MKSYNIFKEYEQIDKNDYTRLTKLYLCYTLDSLELFKNFDFTDEFIQILYDAYLKNQNYCDIVAYCKAVSDFFEVENISPADVKTAEQLYNILKEIY